MFMPEAVMYAVCKNVVDQKFREEGIASKGMRALVSNDIDPWAGAQRLLRVVRRLLAARLPAARRLTPAASEGAVAQ